MGPRHAAFELPAVTAAVADARSSATAVLRSWGVVDAPWEADFVLVVSELVANAVRHGRGPVQVALEVTASGTVRVHVQDCAPHRPRMRSAGPDAENGRGLAIVEAMSARWGVHDVPGGKRVWAELPAPLRVR